MDKKTFLLHTNFLILLHKFIKKKESHYTLLYILFQFSLKPDTYLIISV